MRAFVAVPIPRAGAPADGPGPIGHLTLHFLGEIGSETVAAIRAALPPRVAAHRRFPLTLEGVGAFPSAERPRVVWRGITRGREELERLAGSVRSADVGAGAAADPRPFAPHLTWFRVVGRPSAARARAVLSGELPAPPPESVEVAEVWLVASELGAGGAVHRPIDRFPLADG